MIISASRRTDIPAYYSAWFFNRIKAGHVLVRNPMNIHSVSKVNLSPEVVDGIVFWTKNPAPMIEKLEALDDYAYYFQFTLNAYGQDIESKVPSKYRNIIPTFQRLSQKIGRNRLVWRYDPIFSNDKYTIEYHCKYFERLCECLHEYTEKCTVSFIDMYRNIAKNMTQLHIDNIPTSVKYLLMNEFSCIAKKYGLAVDTCAEDIDLSEYGISHAHCIDKTRLENISGFRLSVNKDKSQREACGCIESVDIGMYNTCGHGCKYCYANYSGRTAEKNANKHDISSPLICGTLTEEDKVSERAVKSCRDCQLDLFD